MFGFLKKRIIKSIRRKMVDTALPAFRKNKKLDNLKHNFQLLNICTPNKFVHHLGNQSYVRNCLGLDSEGIFKKLAKYV